MHRNHITNVIWSTRRGVRDCYSVAYVSVTMLVSFAVLESFNTNAT